ncbi:DUF167 family protein [Phyllobacterium sp. YR531]|uniref:DUF167 family protein n=1 Tax=Phyllobacterium sp. YR531 TaxID=1144343 RepID=UPI00026F63A3|nr:DUF167 family protein [Phyllobacterium sp. YR531]EJN05672.1 hypothetical protein PMI41_00879 [Phyllobacterium sp. YR531]
MVGSYFRTDDHGLTLFVRLTPKSAKDAIEGVEAVDDSHQRVKARVRAVPEDGKAIAALVKLLGRWLDVPPRSITIVAGATSRLKQIKVQGDPDTLIARLSGLLKL